MNNYTKAMILRMARLSGVTVSDDHLRILKFAYDYYGKHQIGPLYRNFEKQIGVDKQRLDSLFPHGLQSIYTWIGIPIQSPDSPCKPIPEISVKEYREVYLDHQATTYLRKEVVDLLNRFNKGALGFGNPSSSTLLGKQAHDLIQAARAQVARGLNVNPERLIFVSGGSEANNLAIKGLAFKHLKKKGRIITSQVEHPSVLESVRFLEGLGFKADYLGVDREGRVSPRDLKKHLQADTFLVAIMAANHEIGTVNPLEEIGEICRKARVPFMTDAVQAFGRIDLRPKEMGISLLSLSGHKIYAPKGVGVLYLDEDISLGPLIHGGGQENGLRSGTENVGSICALGKAAEMIVRDMTKENKRLRALKDYFLEGLRRIGPDNLINGSLTYRLPHNLSIGFPGVDGGALLLALNQIGVFVSSGAACSAGNQGGSHVLRAIGINSEKVGVIRFSFGLRTTQEDLDYVLEHLPVILEKLK
jgi:cysteine desulfurase